MVESGKALEQRSDDVKGHSCKFDRARESCKRKASHDIPRPAAQIRRMNAREFHDSDDDDEWPVVYHEPEP